MLSYVILKNLKLEVNENVPAEENIVSQEEQEERQPRISSMIYN